MIIDCHCHAGQGDGLSDPSDTDAPLRCYLSRARQAGIARTVVFPAFNSDYALANRRLAALVRRQPERLIGFAFVHAERDRGRVTELVHEAVAHLGFQGIKVHRADARLSREICEAARKYHLPVLYDVFGDVASVELFAPQYPDVAFIIPHLGSFADNWREQLAMIDHLVRHPNVFADTSGVRRFDLLVQAVQRAGPHKLLFGSDAPILHCGLELAKVRALGLPAVEFAAVTSGNLLAVLSWSRLAQRVSGFKSRVGERGAVAQKIMAGCDSSR